MNQSKKGIKETKKQYSEPEMEVIGLDREDMILTSGDCPCDKENGIADLNCTCDGQSGTIDG